MIFKILDWIKNNKLAFCLLLLTIFFLLQKQPSVFRDQTLNQADGLIGEMAMVPAVKMRQVAPAPEVKERLVAQESTVSLLVKKVEDAQKTILAKAEGLGGYLVASNLSSPEETKAVSGTITVRLPQEKLGEALDYFRTLAVKVISENLSGDDVTDEYVDLEARLSTLLKTKAKFEEILSKAQKVSDILEVQRELTNLQQQIDGLKGQQNYLEKNAQMSRLTAYLSTDEFSLPYTPSNSWRPEVIFKQAVRSLVGLARKLATAIIWLGIYSIIWLPALLIYRRLKGPKKTS